MTGKAGRAILMTGKKDEQRDRNRAILRKTDFHVVLIALVTAVFEVLGMSLAGVYTAQDFGAQALILAAVIVPVGIVTSLVLPRFLPLDPLIMALTNFLCAVGIVTLSTVSPSRGFRQVMFYMIGLLLMVCMAMVVSRVKKIRGLTMLLMVLGIGALLLPLLFGEWNYGAKNWISLPLIGSFQPSELAKIAVIFSLAYYFSSHRTFFQMLPALVFAALCLVLLMLQRDLGTALIYYLTTVAVFYIACGNVLLTAAGLGGGVAAAILGYRMFAHVKVRVAMWKNPWSDPTGYGYQIVQGLFAIGSGGLFGMGLGQGTPGKIPAYYNDFIYAVICEQFGQIFAVLLIVVYLVLFVRGIDVSMHSRHSVVMLLGCGTVFLLAVQTFMITAGVIKLIPLTGVTMPFLSYGGSSLISCLTMTGILHGAYARMREDIREDVLLKTVGRRKY